MPHVVKLKSRLTGFAASNNRPGSPVTFEVCGFHTSDEGRFFRKLLESCELFLAGRPDIIKSQVDHMLVVMKRDGAATVYVNELSIVAKAQVLRGLQAGQAVTTDDIADITELDVGVEVPRDCGVLFLFSWEWRKGIYFDLRPMAHDPVIREYDCPPVFAACHCALVFPEKFSLTDDHWLTLYSAGWFPFVGLKSSTITEMVLHLQEGWDLSDLNARIIQEAKALTPEFADVCGLTESFTPHVKVIRAAAQRFGEGDYLSAAHLLYPRIEGVLRTYYQATGDGKHPKQYRFINAAISGSLTGRHAYCLLLLDRFGGFLEKVIFAGFDPKAPTGTSRHTVGHGVVNVDDCDEKSVASAFLTLHHLYYSLATLE